MRRLLWVALLLTACLWSSYVVWSTSPFQSCIGEEEQAETAHAIQDNPTKVTYSLLVLARIDTVCAGRWAFGSRDAAIAIATVFIAFFTLTLWRSTHNLWHEAVKAGETAAVTAAAAKKSADAALLSLRPWLSCEAEIVGPLTFDGIVNNTTASAVFPIKFTITNRGHAPAMGVTLFFPRFNLLPGEPSGVILERLAQRSRGLPVKGAITLPGGAPLHEESGKILFPGEDFSETQRISIDRRSLEKFTADLKEPKPFWAELIVLVSYTYRLAEIRADTGMVFEITNETGKPLTLDESIPSNQMRIKPHDMWGGFAT